LSIALTETAFVALDRAALAVLIGLCASWLYLATRHNADTVEASPGIGALLGLSLLTLAVTSSADLLMRAATLADVGITEAWTFVPRIVTGSDYGQSWMLRSGALIIIAALWLWRRSPPLAGLRGITAFGALLTAFAISSTGHAAEDGSLTPLNLVNTLHIVAGCVWGGTVVVYALSILPHLRRVQAAGMIAETAARLSTLAGTALAIVLATGLYHAWVQIETLDALVSTDYGWTLIIKLSFVAIMMGIGALNRFFVVPSIEAWAQPPRLSPDTEGPPRVFLNRLRIDVAVFAAILVCAAALGNTTPARHAIHEAALAAPIHVCAEPRTETQGV
jgi:copper resistance protein D